MDVSLLPFWPRDRYIELAPRYWRITRARLDPEELELEIPPERWPSMRDESCALLHATMNGAERLDACAAELERRLASLDRTVATGANVRVEDGELVISPLEAEELPDDVKQLQALVADRLPKVELADLLGLQQDVQEAQAVPRHQGRHHARRGFL